MQALRVLGGHDENPVFRAGMLFLLHAQQSDGRWPTDPTAAGDVGASSSSPITSYSYLPTLAAVRVRAVRCGVVPRLS